MTLLGKTFRSRTVLLLLAGIPLLLWLLWASLGIQLVVWTQTKLGTTEAEFSRLGQTGDLFGGINALFAAWAFAGVAAAAYFQRQTFIVVEEQQKQQAFEPLFFKLLELNRSLLPTEVGGYHFPGFVEQALRQASWADTVAESDMRKAVCEQYEALYVDSEGKLGPYFRTLYHAFKLIDRSGLGKSARVEYANIARSMMTREEYLLLMLNCACERGAEFKPLIEKYGLLKHLPKTTSILGAPQEFAKKLYEPTAVMNSEQRELHWVEYPDKRPADMPRAAN